MPNENEVRSHIADRHSRLIAHCASVVKLAASRLEQGEIIDSGLAPLTIQTLLGLLVRAVKTTRGAMLLYEAGLSTDAGVLLRSLFEVRVAIRFVGLKSLTLTIKQHPAPVVDPSRPMTCDFRALLYVAHQELEYLRMLDEFASSPNPKIAALAQPVHPDRVKFLEHLKQEIGPLWTDVLVKRRSYSGLQHADLVDSVGVDEQKRVVFRRLSWLVHGGDALEHAEYTEDGAFALSVTPESTKVDEGLTLLAGTLVNCLKTAVEAGLRFWTDEELWLHLFPPGEAPPRPE